MGKITDYRRKFFTSEDPPAALGYGQPGVIVELFETHNGPNAGVNATVHRFSQMPRSQDNEVLYCFEDTTQIPVRDIGEHCTVSSAPHEGEAPPPPASGPRYNCSYAIDMRHCFWQQFDWESHREQALGLWDQGLSSGDVWNVVKKRPGDRFAPDPPKATLGTRKREEADPKRLDAELWLESLSKGGEATGSPPKKPRAISLDATIDIATPAPGTPRYDPAFTDPEATIVLTSADGLSYRLHPFVLRTSSRITLVDANLGESSEVLGQLFRIMSGLGAGRWETLDDVERVLSAAYKYKMPGPISDIRGNVLASFIAAQPLQVFFIAAHYE
ncbi:hypothetical protein FIBSPDRAFT_947421 [Athelia psychrophila]|uniref:BTB domain-containing protein n=1 Tax=Athelia psychrophila TaxID=1759441 RepID=A0A166RRY1_9AGAM|nr:hypothetical protein FIBSPDRAFT_947421 [Fibularhizoctonia sp. CBS 109695]